MGNGACFDCLCHSCANNADNLLTDGSECERPCFYCDDCMAIDGANRPMRSCKDYKITNKQAKQRREGLKKYGR